MKFKIMRHWSDKEDNILKEGYEKYGFNSHNPASKNIQTELIKKLKIFRSIKAIHRRANRLGIQTYIYGDVVIDTNCCVCKKPIQTYKRHIKLYKNIKCKDCAEINKNNSWKKNNRSKEYYKYYYEKNKRK